MRYLDFQKHHRVCDWYKGIELLQRWNLLVSLSFLLCGLLYTLKIHWRLQRPFVYKDYIAFFFFTILGVKTEKFNILSHLKIPIRGAQLGALWWPTGMGWELGSGGRSIRRGYVYIHSWLLKIHVKNQQENGENINKKITHAYVNSLFLWEITM